MLPDFYLNFVFRLDFLLDNMVKVIDNDGFLLLFLLFIETFNIIFEGVSALGSFLVLLFQL